MECLIRACSSSSSMKLASPLNQTQFHQTPFSNLSSNQLPKSPLFSKPNNNKSRFKLYTKTSDIISSDFIAVPSDQDEKFDWFSQWYPVMPVCDLDKRVPHGKKVMGLDIVVWWDKNESAWKVFDDCCPHRLAPLSQGRIDQWGRLQCVYHGWCFSGAGDCKFIPQAPRDGPPVILLP